MNQTSISDYSSFKDSVYRAATEDGQFGSFLYQPEILKIFGHYKYENALKIWDKMKDKIVDSVFFRTSQEKIGDTLSLLPRHYNFNDFRLGTTTIKMQSFVLEFVRVIFDIKEKLRIDNLTEFQIVEQGVGLSRSNAYIRRMLRAILFNRPAGSVTAF